MPEVLTWWQALILGLVQGITEWLPISSTAHLRIVPALLGWPDAGTSFSAVIQLGSLVALLIYFWRDLSQFGLQSWHWLRREPVDPTVGRLLLGILVGTIPLVILGLAVKVFLGEPPRQLWVVAATSIGLSIVLALAERWGRRQREVKDLTLGDAIWVGFAQAAALIPGVSRSGGTLTMGLFLHLKREAAARYSFLLGIPALLLSGAVEFVSDFELSNLPIQLAGTLSAFVFSYLTIDALLKFLQRSSTWVFIIYRVLLGIGILVGLGTGILTG
ncbi:MAG: undecaprenyl-diphosphate phosphatase [Cyanophyceae cyanobacterium]